MKKIITFLLMLATVVPVAAQQYNHTRRARLHNDTDHYYGLRLGLNSASLGSDNAEMDLNARTGLNFGAVYGLQLTTSAPIWLEAGLTYSEKGGKTTVLGNKITSRMSYLELPVVCKYSFDVYDDFYIQPFVGGYLALGIGGKTKDYSTHTSTDSFDDLNRFDGGLRLGCGFEYMMIYAELGMEFGLANISRDDFDTARTQNIFINIGVNF